MTVNGRGAENDDVSGESATSTAQSNGNDSEEHGCATQPEPELDDFGLPVKKTLWNQLKGEEVEVTEEGNHQAQDYEKGEASAVNTSVAARPDERKRQDDSSSVAQSTNGESRSQENGVPPPPLSSVAKTSTVKHHRDFSEAFNGSSVAGASGVSEWSHQALVSRAKAAEQQQEEDWKDMPAFAPYDLYDDDGKLVAREAQESDDEANAYAGLGGAGKGYTRVQIDDDAKSATSMDENTSYLFKETGTNVVDEDEEHRDPLAQMQATKDLLTEGQRIAYVGVVRLSMAQMVNELEKLKATKGVKKELGVAVESMKVWGQKMMIRLYAHMEIDSSEQIMIEQLAEHGVQPHDLTPALMQNSRVKNPMADDEDSLNRSSITQSPCLESDQKESLDTAGSSEEGKASPPPPPYAEHEGNDLPEVRTPSQMPTTKKIDIDLRWTVLCDLFLVLIGDSIYDSRSRTLLEKVGASLDVPWLEICRFEKRVTEALEMQEEASKETWDEAEHMENRRKLALKRKYVMMGLATVGGSLVIGLSAGLLAPVIGAGLAAGFTTIGVAGTGGFLAGAGGTAIITSGAVLSGGTIAVRAAHRRTGAVKTFEYRPLHNNKRVNLIVTISGWMNGKVDDVRLPYSTVDPIMGDMYSLLWEPEMLQSMGDTINILATEALTQGLQQVLGSTILVALMASLQLPIVLTKLSYLIDNPWTVSLDRAQSAGLILADSLIDRNLGVRPITLVGFSLGARVIFSCLRELASKGAFGLIQNVYLFGSPIVAKSEEYLRVRTVISGRFVNGYAKNDWILGYLFRATSGGIMRVAGLAPVEGVPDLENIDVTQLVNGHMAYRAAMPRLLREVGWMIESEEFTEIEDPDPENHEKRQRELIREIDEARKEAEAKPGKRRFGFFKRGKLAEKKGWETYDDRMREETTSGSGSNDVDAGQNVLFDVEAIRAELASEQIEVRQLESTLPPMKLDLDGSTNRVVKSQQNPYSNLRETKSYDDSSSTRPKAEDSSAKVTVPNGHSSNPFDMGYDEYEGIDEVNNHSRGPESVQMSFDPSERSQTLLRPPDLQTISAASPTPRSSAVLDIAQQRTVLQTSPTLPMSAPAVTLEHNAWADHEVEDVGAQREIKMSFE